MLGVVGDSASGKTTLTKGIVDALGADQVTAICSDDYHRYNRKQRKELGISALDPECNYMDIMEQHFRLLREGKAILKPIYNHSTGDFDAPEYIKPTKYVIIEGLLPFHSRLMRLCFDVKVYLNPPRDLRYEWKIKRDMTKRGYSREQVLASLKKREGISPRFIDPQRQWGDMVVRFHPPEEPTTAVGLNARVVLRPTIPHPDLVEILKQGSNGTNPALWLELGRYDSKPVDFLNIGGHVTNEKAREMEEAIQSHLPSNCNLDLDKLGAYQDGLIPRKSYPLALTQLLIAYHMIQAGDAVEN